MLESNENHTAIALIQNQNKKVAEFKANKSSPLVIKHRNHSLLKYISRQQLPQRKQEEIEDKENLAEDKNKENDNSNFQVYRCTIKEVVKISTYIGCKIHEYKLSKNGF